MKKKGNFRKVVSGLLAGMTMLSTVLSPMTAYAAEIQPEEKPPLYEEVKDLLDEDEVVTAKDYEIETGSVFDVKSDYTGLEIKDDNKVKVLILFVLCFLKCDFNLVIILDFQSCVV